MIKLLTKTWPFWVIAMLLVFPSLHPRLRTETMFAVEGTIYQVIGVLTVILGVDDRLRHFRGSSILGTIREWFRQLKGLFQKRVITGVIGATDGSDEAFG